MKIAILSDNHGNVPALQTVIDHIEAWQPDHIIFNGDVVNRGPNSLESWQILQAKRQHNGWHITRGNHEDYVLRHETEPADTDHTTIQAQINKNSWWTYHQVKDHCADMAALPDHVTLTAPDGSELIATHASMRGNQDCMFPNMDAAAVRPQIAPAPAVFITSHIHHAYTRQLDETLIVNSGSAGHHNSYDTRATYAQVVWQNGRWQAEIIRLTYDMAATERAYYHSGFMEETGPVANLIFYEWKTAVPLLPIWRAQYQDAVLSDTISLESSVNEFLQSHL